MHEGIATEFTEDTEADTRCRVEKLSSKRRDHLSQTGLVVVTGTAMLSSRRFGRRGKQVFANNSFSPTKPVNQTNLNGRSKVKTDWHDECRHYLATITPASGEEDHRLLTKLALTTSTVPKQISTD